MDCINININLKSINSTKIHLPLKQKTTDGFTSGILAVLSLKYNTGK